MCTAQQRMMESMVAQISKQKPNNHDSVSVFECGPAGKLDIIYYGKSAVEAVEAYFKLLGTLPDNHGIEVRVNGRKINV